MWIHLDSIECGHWLHGGGKAFAGTFQVTDCKSTPCSKLLSSANVPSYVRMYVYEPRHIKRDLSPFWAKLS